VDIAPLLGNDTLVEFLNGTMVRAPDTRGASGRLLAELNPVALRSVPLPAAARQVTVELTPEEPWAQAAFASHQNVELTWMGVYLIDVPPTNGIAGAPAVLLEVRHGPPFTKLERLSNGTTNAHVFAYGARSLRPRRAAYLNRPLIRLAPLGCAHAR